MDDDVHRVSMDPLTSIEIEALATVFSTEKRARRLLSEAGFPATRHPGWSTADEFWHEVAAELDAGALPGGRREVLTKARQQFPANSVFAAWGRPSPDTGGSGTGGPDAGGPGADGPGAVPAARRPTRPASMPPTGSVPPRAPVFTGRDGLLSAIRRRLIHERVQAVALSGMGGVGKTELAVQYADRNAGSYDLVWWVRAEQPVLVGQQVAALAPSLGLAPTGDAAEDASRVVAALARRRRWLLIFDNVEQPDDIRLWLPGGRGHVLVTSRARVWGGIASQIDVEPLDPAAAVELLRRRLPKLAPDAAAQLAAETGRLPLALAQTTAYLQKTGLPAADYLTKLRAARDQLHDRGVDQYDDSTIDATFSLSLEELDRLTPAAGQFLALVAHFGPGPIPLSLFTEQAELLPEPLRGAVTHDDPKRDLDALVGAGHAYHLLDRTANAVQAHRVIQTVIRARMPAEERARSAQVVRDLLVAASPTTCNDRSGWPHWAALTPHVLDAPAARTDDEAAAKDENMRGLQLATSSYLTARGDFGPARVLVERLHRAWTGWLGPDHPDSLTAGHRLARELARLGQLDEAWTLAVPALSRRRRILGPDHPHTLSTARTVAEVLARLGELDDAAALAEENLDGYRRTYGPGHPRTTAAADLLADLLERQQPAESSPRRWFPRRQARPGR